MTVSPRIKAIDSPDVDDLDAWVCPYEPASLVLQLSVGPADIDGADVFDVLACNLGWLAKLDGDRPIGLRHHVLVPPGSAFQDLRGYLETRVHACSAETWAQVGQLIGRFARWEFEDYRD